MFREGFLLFLFVIGSLSASIKPRNEQYVLSPRPEGTIDYKNYYKSQKIIDSIQILVNAIEGSELRAEVFEYGRTYLDQPMIAVRIGLRSNEESEIPVILLDAGIHGNEWIGPAAGHYIAENLLTNPEGLEILKDADVVLTPIVNRDGYDFSVDMLYPVQIGRKNRMPSNNKKCLLKETTGTNINRNFDWYWDSLDSKEDPCGQDYRGDYPFSAPETLALAKLMETPNVKYYHTIHSFGNLILWPFGTSNETLKYFEITKDVALAGKVAVEEEFGQVYKLGSTVEVLYPASGASKDYAAGRVGIPISLIHEIGGRDLDFQPPKSDILPYVGMAWTVFKANSLKALSASLN